MTSQKSSSPRDSGTSPTLSLRQKRNKYEPLCVQKLGQDIPQWKNAEGARVAGMIDFTSGLMVANIGHDRQEILDAIAMTRDWTAWYSPNPHRLRAYQTLAKLLPGYKFVLLNSGSEAIDCAMKIARDNGCEPRAFQEDTYWGSTIGAKSLEGEWKPAVKGMKEAWFAQAFKGRTCEWLQDLVVEGLVRNQKDGALIVFDEMQAGFGRTGRWFGFQWYDVQPDIVVGGKAAAGGLPFAFVAVRPSLADANPMADYPSTFSANSICCEAFVETVRIIRDEKLVQKAWHDGHIIGMALAEMGLRYNGRGFAWAFPHENTCEVAARSRDLGLLVIDTMRGWVKIAPPLTITEHDLRLGMSMLKKAL